MDRLDAIRLFVRVVDSGSFAVAAREAGVGQPAVSKQVASLERYFGAQLMRRSSRSMTLTTEGQTLYEAGVKLLGDFDDAAAAIGRGRVQVSGLIRVTVAPMFGRLYVVPSMPALFASYPELMVDLTATERPVNLVEEGYDLVIRHGAPTDSTLVARWLAASPYVLVATPAYLERHGVPAHPNDLACHSGVLFSPGHVVRAWQFRNGSQALSHVPRGPFRSADAEQIRAAVMADMGLAQAPAWMFAAELALGTVLEVLAPFAPAPLDVYALHPAGRRLSSKVRVFRDFLEASLGREPAPAFLPRSIKGA